MRSKPRGRAGSSGARSKSQVRLCNALDLPRGMRDFEGGEFSKIERVRDEFGRLCALYGFSPMDPSPMELLSVMETRSGPAIRDEIYCFTDKGSREVALRFDFTIGLTRYMASQQSVRLPAKVSAFGGVFRYDEPQRGRYRYFHQWDVEVYGRPGIESEAEIIEMTSRLFDALHLSNITIDVSHRGLMESRIGAVFGSSDGRLVGDILRAVDKTQKKPRGEILREFGKKGYDTAKLEEILEFSQLRGTPGEIESRSDVSGLESWDHLKLLFESLANRGVSNARVNLGIVRGLDYYSGTVFEVFDTSSDLGALAGGGRYDSLTRAFGREDLGAAGVAGGVERIILAMDAQGVWPAAEHEKISVLYANDRMQGAAMAVSSGLRRHGIATEIDLVGRSLKKQMELASGSRYAVIIAPRELEAGRAVLRDMADRSETTVELDRIRRDPRSVFSP